MRNDQLLALVAICAPATVAAAGVIPMSITRTNRAVAPSVRRRSDTYTETIGNNISYGGYFATVSVGTPGQSQEVILDTGSSDAWFLSTDATLCGTTSSSSSTTSSSSSSTTTSESGSGSGPGSGRGGFGNGGRSLHSSSTYRRRSSSSSACLTTFDYSSSTSYTNVSEVFDISYVDGSSVQGFYFTDDIEIGGATIDSLQMGLANTSDIYYGILGIGFPLNEAAATTYPNIIDKFYSEGLIGAKAYSLFLDDLESSTGTILFGGVDSDKYTGDLIALPIIKDASANNYTSFSVTLSSVAAVYTNGTLLNNYTMDATAVILDSGTTLTYLPETVAEEVMTTFGATYDSSLGYATVDCSLAEESDIVLEYQFGGDGGPIIQVALSELVLQTGSGMSMGPGGSSSSESSCAFGVSGSSDYLLLGDTFLRSAYAVYDLDNKEIALAQSNVNSTSTSITTITSDSGIPNVASTATAVIASSTSSSGDISNSKSGATSMAAVSWISLVGGATIAGALLILA